MGFHELFTHSKDELTDEIRTHIKENRIEHIKSFSAEYFLEMNERFVDDESTKEQCVVINEIAEHVITNPDKELEITYNFADVEMEFISETLNETVVHDISAKQLTYLTMILNYTEEDQQNVGFQSGSSTGKTHIVVSIAEFFPQEDVQKIGYITPTAFYHQYGILRDEEGNEFPNLHEYVAKRVKAWDEKQKQEMIDNGEWDEYKNKPAYGMAGTYRDDRRAHERQLKEEWHNTPKENEVDLHQTILISLDQPNDVLLQRIRPLLSHDDKRIEAHITDKTAGGRHQTKKTVLIGYPTFFFLSANASADEQERNRMFLLSAEASAGKIKSSIRMLARKLANRTRWRSNLDSHVGRRALMERIQGIKAARIDQIVIPYKMMDEITDRFIDEHPSFTPRLQRDFPRLISVIKAHALNNLWTRERDGNNIIATEYDVKVGYELYKMISDANERGLTPALWKFYNDTLVPAINVDNYIDRRKFVALWKEARGEMLGYHKTKALIYSLRDAALIDEIEHPEDSRKRAIVIHGNNIAIEKKDESFQEVIDEATPETLLDHIQASTRKLGRNEKWLSMFHSKDKVITADELADDKHPLWHWLAEGMIKESKYAGKIIPLKYTITFEGEQLRNQLLEEST